MSPDLEAMPRRATGDLLTPTLNGMGYMFNDLDEVSRAFVDFACRAPGPVLDVGTAFGATTQAALRAGARVIANDLDPRHLDILWAAVPAGCRERLTLLPGAFPDHILVEDDALGGALLSRVMHFFDGPQVERASRELHRSLAVGGKVFVVVDKSVFLDEPPLRDHYESRRQRGERWPGFFADVSTLLPVRSPLMPKQVHYLDPDVLLRTFQEAGFEIQSLDVLTRAIPTGDGWSRLRDSIGLVACKGGVRGEKTAM